MAIIGIEEQRVKNQIELTMVEQVVEACRVESNVAISPEDLPTVFFSL
jgi:hypothetical protein